MAEPSSNTLLGGLSAARFMKRHWQRRPLLVRGAWPGVMAPVSRAELFAMAARDDVESRLVDRSGSRWTVRHGPLPRRALPAMTRPGWTLLVQGVDLHVAEAARMLAAFRFVPAARLDDLMISWASDGGGVGPHEDAYDVFLVQLQGRRRWRVGPVHDDALVEGAPLKLLRHFEPESEWVLEPGDMLYLPPRWGHDGVADGPCMTASIGFRVPGAASLGRELLQQWVDALGDKAESAIPERLYRDAGQAPASRNPAAIPAALQRFGARCLTQALAGVDVERLLGELLSEPKPRVWFHTVAPAATLRSSPRGWRVALGTRMLYDERHLFINGESYRIAGRDATILRAFADDGQLSAAARRRLSASAREIVFDWWHQGWLSAEED